ncbi:ABC transporter substrate-binding protein [Rhizobium rosettiformans]|jgi:multiple sugar transport system substrate-binding protein|uniref:Extracellular solute-binding protein n=2 Tax=Rhizobium rosettiformans TaxID=1368430 RepID=A0A4V4HRR6_9HYPH|nr:extracellular solute-binding protein [Rhizobium rosettiformans]MBA4797730.1 extracellular solute-binding protein [Hyphomicrobiales bacterium]MBB5275254.1 multiple sugar transport system substrate-binding protein [Rhizobium rosettiformans]MDR7029053.1 multiple sugar transport system substrate-binding protein [Rhizobium rosettiformans]MDR7062767.1 multiple sugar transport system substrate-binding protein [Rhizobium rosettiformans]THV38936.1 extracellular solute-binding protein [Rhizobium rose
MTRKLTMLAGSFALLASSALTTLAADQEISWIYCGDVIDPIHEKYIAEWESKNEGWKVKPEVVGWEQCQDKATTLAVAGTPVAMAYVGSRTLKEFAQNELIVPVPMTDEEKASYYPNIVDTVTFDDTQWGVPIAFSTKALYWNKDLFKQAGLDPETPPKTWAEEIEFAKQIKEKTGIAGYGLPAKTFDNTMHQFMHWVYTNNGKVIDGDTIVMDSPEVLAALQAYKDITPYSVEGATAYEQNEIRAIFLDGKVGMIQAGSGAAYRLKDTQINWGVAPLPQGPSAKGEGTLLITDSLAIFSGSGVEEKAIEFAKYITSTDIQHEYELQGGAGLTPLRPGPVVDEFVAKEPFWKPFIDGIAYGGPEPLFTDYKGFQNVMIEMVQSVVTGKAEPADALKKAAADLEQYK